MKEAYCKPTKPGSIPANGNNVVSYKISSCHLQLLLEGYLKRD